MKICIDAGHGGSDPGAVGNGLKEKDITLAISLKIAKKLSQYKNVEVVLTRNKDVYLPLSNVRTPQCDVSVSVHVNSGGGQGLETWTAIYNKAIESQKLGKLIHQNILKQIPFEDRGIKSKKSSTGNQDYLYMIRKPIGVPVLVECGFIDNYIDAGILKQESNLEKIAQGIVNGIVQYTGIKEDDDDMTKTKILYNNKEFDGFIVDGTSYVEVRKLAEALGLNVTWNAQKNIVELKK
ncbi:N-acetylmuramoyl-L-alanine amidase [Thermoanaerobacterium sp. DL9XJH110]|uniref:N-acetylmuramoyl-L-alanine amidase n=1 Tax=Thermoanaerobacterium sp. DL9XJH110 TaxID=3386643 RepID=UPI003BB72213